MCLVALAIDHDRRFPLVIAANRDEFFKRPTARLGWWTPESGGPASVAPVDVPAGAPLDPPPGVDGAAAAGPGSERAPVSSVVLEHAATFIAQRLAPAAPATPSRGDQETLI